MFLLTNYIIRHTNLKQDNIKTIVTERNHISVYLFTLPVKKFPIIWFGLLVVLVEVIFFCFNFRNKERKHYLTKEIVDRYVQPLQLGK